MIKKIKLYIYLIAVCICLPKIFFSQILYPTDISGIVGWYSSDSISSTNGTQIPNWNDLSGNNNDLIQPSVLNQGAFFTNQLNNKPCIRLDGINSFYSFTDSVDFRTIIIVGKANEAVFSDYRGLFGGPLSSLSIGGYLINGIGGSSNLGQGTNSSNFSQMLKNNISTFPTGDFNPLNNYWIGNFEFTTNRKQTSDFGRIDNGNQPGRYWFGDIFEIIIYNKTLSSIESNDIFNYLSQKYAPSVVLPPDITVSNSLCDTVITTNSNFENYNWSTGATTPTISVNQTGKYWVTATNVFGKISSDTILVSYPGHFLSQNATLCFGDSIVWNTNLPKNQYICQWQDNSSDSVFTIKQGGNYYVKITDSYGCNITSDTAKIVEDNFASSVSLGHDTSLCAGNSITLTSGLSPSLTYTWSTGSHSPSLLINTTGQYSVVVTNTNNCVARDTINVNVAGQAPTANFTYNIGCINSIVYFNNSSAPPVGNTLTSYYWDFGDGASATNTSSLTNPSHTYTNTGTYTVSLKVITNAGCEQTISKTIQVFPKPTINFTNGISCQNDSTAFSSLCTSTPGYSITALNWNFGDPISLLANTSNLLSPKHLFSNQTNYTIKLVATNNVGCKDSLTNIIAVKSQVKADFSYSSACTNTATLFQDNSIVPAPNASNIRSWNFGTSTASGITVSKSYTNSGVYSVTLTITGNNGCNSSISKVITIFNPPITSFTIPTFCAKDTVTAINTSIAQSGIISSYNWRLNTVSFSSIQNPTLSIASAGNYSVGLTITNNFGCRDSLTKIITVNPLPTVDFTTNPATYYYINSPITFSPTINNANFYFWNISTVPTTTIQSPTVTFNSEGTYTASLLLQDQQGCKNSITKNLTVTKRFLDIAVLNVNSTKNADGFVSVQTDIVNYGTIPASSIELNYQVSDGANVKEIWTGTLIPKSYFTYNFNSKTATQPQSTNHVTCVDAKKVNGMSDEKLDNNKLCNALNSNEIDVSNPIPNPTNSDITLPIILNKDMDFSISIYNSTGQIIYEEQLQKGATGLNLITLPSSNYNRGCYIIKTMIDDKVFIKKFIKISNE